MPSSLDYLLSVSLLCGTFSCCLLTGLALSSRELWILLLEKKGQNPRFRHSRFVPGALSVIAGFSVSRQCLCLTIPASSLVITAFLCGFFQMLVSMVRAEGSSFLFSFLASSYSLPSLYWGSLLTHCPLFHSSKIVIVFTKFPFSDSGNIFLLLTFLS